MNQLPNLRALPVEGDDRAAVINALRTLQAKDRTTVQDIKFGRRFFSRADVLDVVSEAYGLFAQTGRYSPYPGLPTPPSMQDMEQDITAAAIALMGGGPDARAVLTSGGTESVIMAVKSCLTQMRKTGKVTGQPNIVAPWSSHPCLDKAAELMGIELRRVAVLDDGRADLTAMATAMTPQTIMLYGSYPSYSYGLDDDIVGLGALAQLHNVWLHVDACMSGFLAPFARMNGVAMPDFDFRVLGVTSISADLHKHGYAAKGISALLFRNSHVAQYHSFTYEDYPLPSMTTPTLAGTAPGAPIASAWAAMRYLGIMGYRALTADLYAARDQFVAAINRIPGFAVLGLPLFSLLVVTSNHYDMIAVHRALEKRGWFTLLVRKPSGIHLNIGTTDASLATIFADDLRDIVKEFS